MTFDADAEAKHLAVSLALDRLVRIYGESSIADALQRAHEAGRRAGIEAAIAIVDGRGAPDYIRGCSDGDCVIVRPLGMHTNGGCKCGRIYGDQADKDAGRLLRRRVEWTAQEIRALRKPEGT